MTQPPLSADDIRALWRTLPADAIVVSAGEMRAKARKFQTRIRTRNFVEYAACALVAVIFGWYATWPEPATPLWAIANMLIILAAAFVAYMMHRTARAEATPDAGGLTGLVDFQRAALARQRDALVSVWRWYILPFAPGFVLFLLAIWVGRPTGAADTTLLIALGAAALGGVAVAVVIILLNLLAAAHLQRQIDDLDRYRETD